MTYRVVIRMTGTDSSLPVFDETDTTAAACKAIFDNYRSQGWIEAYSDSIVSSTVKEETIDFDNQNRWVAFRAELATTSSSTNVSQFTTKEIISESEV